MAPSLFQGKVALSAQAGKDERVKNMIITKILIMTTNL
jgi:hypothetical protein